MRIAYVRVSTAEQNEQRQIDALAKHGIERWFTDKVSGKDTNRPQLQAMLEFAGTGVFMPNGIPQVRAAADYVTLPNSQDGFAHALEELVFARL